MFLVSQAMTSPRSTAVLIVNYRTGPLVLDCLRSLEPELRSEPCCQVIVVDNDSKNGSFEQIEEAIHTNAWAGWAQIVPAGRNAGFAAGNNVALRSLLQSPDAPTYYWLLNPDTLVRQGALKALLDFLESSPQAGIAGSWLEHPDGTPLTASFHFPSVIGEWEGGFRLGLLTKLLKRWVVAPFPQPRLHQTDWVCGASMIVRREVFDAIGLLDENYFLYYEETDFCLRAKRAGWECWLVPDSKVIHLEGQSTGATGSRSGMRPVPAHWWESRQYYYRKNYGRSYERMASLSFALAYALWRIRRWLQRKPDTDPPHLLRDFLRFHFGRK